MCGISLEPAPDVPVKDLPRISEAEVKMDIYIDSKEAGLAIGGTGNTVRAWLRNGVPRTEEPLKGKLPKPRRKGKNGIALWLRSEWLMWRELNIDAKAPNIEGNFRRIWRKDGKMNCRKGAK